MSRRDQPYIPLYVMDFLTDEKLRECSAESVGVYIMLMCVMHKQEEYGTIALREKDRKSADIISDFSAKLAKHLPFGEGVIYRAIQELLAEGVVRKDGEKLIQKRMVRDADISDKRSTAGRKGSATTNAKIDVAKLDEVERKGSAKDDPFVPLPSPTASPPPAEGGTKELPKRKRGKPEKPKIPKIQYAEFVSMTEEEYKKLLERFGEEKTKRAIEIIDNYKGQSGRTYESDYRAILNWTMERVDEEFEKRGGSSHGGTYTDRGNSGRSADPGGFRQSGGFKGQQ